MLEVLVQEQMNIVVIGHVDHGKSTVIGRLLADTGSLPVGKLDAVKEHCRRSARPFEYAFLLDALKDEQAQGITIDTARCFFKSDKRHYIIIDAPGHIEFLKNMVSGAARAEAALLIIDAHEGIQENSRRHGWLLSMLGIRQVAVCVNKMDLVGYDQRVFEAVRTEYTAFLEQVNVRPAAFVPISAREGDNMVRRSPNMPWYEGPAILELMDSFSVSAPPVDKPLRFPVQDVYKFTEQGDDRRIVAGRVETGTARIGDEVVFLPSGKRSRISSVEYFNAPPRQSAHAGQAIGFTLEQQIYIRPGEIMCRADQPLPRSTSRVRVNLFWLGRQPMLPGQRYKMKLATARAPVWLTEIRRVMDASTLGTVENRRQIERHDVAECVLEMIKPIACDLGADLPHTGRFVIIDNYEIAGGGVILDTADVRNSLAEKHVEQRQRAWERSEISPESRAARYNQGATLLVLTGPAGTGKQDLARALERHLFDRGHLVYYLGLSNSLLGLSSDLPAAGEREEHLRRLGETAHLFTSAGAILITTISDLDDDEWELLSTLNRPAEMRLVHVGPTSFIRHQPDLILADARSTDRALREVHQMLSEDRFVPDYVV